MEKGREKTSLSRTCSVGTGTKELGVRKFWFKLMFGNCIVSLFGVLASSRISRRLTYTCKFIDSREIHCNNYVSRRLDVRSSRFFVLHRSYFLRSSLLLRCDFNLVPNVVAHFIPEIFLISFSAKNLESRYKIFFLMSYLFLEFLSF